MDIIIIPNIPDLPQGVIKKYFAVWQEDPAVNNTEVFKAISQTLYVIDLVYAEKEEEKCHEMAKFLLSLSMKFPHIISRKYKRKLEEIIYSPQKKKKTNCSRKKKIL